jgi:muramoyltetrapeptide carboxypeptidase
MEKEIKIALFSPSSPPSIRSYQRGIKVLKKNNISFKSFVDFSESSPSFKAFLFYELITAKEYDFIWAVRGGFGAIKLIPYLDEFFSENKKINIYPSLIGFSDVTALHLYFYKKFKRKGLHAPMIVNLPDLSEEVLKNLLEVIAGNKDIELEGFAYKEGEAEGILLGGNLVTLASLCGTTYLPTEKSLILMIEETNEKKYRIERAFLQVIFTLGIENIKGIIIGDIGKVNSLEFLKGVEEFLPKYIPIGYNFSFGHIKNNLPLIVGEKAYLVVKNGKAKLFQRGFKF